MAGSKRQGHLKFPDGVLFGATTSSYQVEGGHEADGKGVNIFDYYTVNNPDKFHDRCHANVSSDSYNRWQDDIKALKDLGATFYRFSISWTRILPNGYANKINPAGIKYYQDIIEECLKNGIEPIPTMFHCDLPMALQEIGGWTNPEIAHHFEDYARILYENLGENIKYWMTVNTTCAGYGDPKFPPFVDQPGKANYMCTYVMLLAHARAYRVYEKEFKNKQKYNAQISLVIDARWYQAGSDSPEDLEAAERVLEFEVGIWLHPLYSPQGDFPPIVKERVEQVSKIEGYPRSRLPTFSPEEIELVRGSSDFLGLNVFSSWLVKHVDDKEFTGTSTLRDEGAKIYQDPSWKGAQSPWLKVYPDGARKMLKWAKDKYGNQPVLITENGFSDDGRLDDTDRIEYLQGYIQSILDAIHIDKVDVKCYGIWSLLDNFEWMAAYSEKFGIYHVDFNDPERKRTPKKSALWFKDVIQRRGLP